MGKYNAKIPAATSFIATHAQCMCSGGLKLLENPDASGNKTAFRSSYITGRGGAGCSRTVLPVRDDVMMASITRCTSRAEHWCPGVFACAGHTLHDVQVSIGRCQHLNGLHGGITQNVFNTGCVSGAKRYACSGQAFGVSTINPDHLGFADEVFLAWKCGAEPSPAPMIAKRSRLEDVLGLLI